MQVLVDAFKRDKFIGNKFKSIREIRNKIVEILTKVKSRNLLKFRFKNLFKSKKIQSVNTIRKLKFLIPGTEDSLFQI